MSTQSKENEEEWPLRQLLMNQVVFARGEVKKVTDELFDVRQQLVKTQEALIEAQSQLIAKNEVILRLKREAMEKAHG